MNAVGVVLAGGKSSRYGKQKLFENWKGAPLVQQSITALHSGGIKTIYVITNNTLIPSFHAISGIKLIIEDSPHNGPLHALHTVMTTVSHEGYYMVLAGDLPNMSGEVVSNFQSFIESEEYDAVVSLQKEELHPLCGIYHSRLIPVLQQKIEDGKKSMRQLLQSCKIKTVPFPETVPYFLNINRVTDWPTNPS